MGYTVCRGAGDHKEGGGTIRIKFSVSWTPTSMLLIWGTQMMHLLLRACWKICWYFCLRATKKGLWLTSSSSSMRMWRSLGKGRANGTVVLERWFWLLCGGSVVVNYFVVQIISRKFCIIPDKPGHDLFFEFLWLHFLSFLLWCKWTSAIIQHILNK